MHLDASLTPWPVEVGSHLPTLHQVTQHHYHATLSVIDCLPEISGSRLHGTLSYDECSLLLVALQHGGTEDERGGYFSEYVWLGHCENRAALETCIPLTFTATACI